MIKIEMLDDKKQFKPLEQIEGNVVWQLDYVPAWIEVRLFWFTSGFGDRDSEIVKRLKLAGNFGNCAQQFIFKLPNEPYSFAGKLITLTWALEAITDKGNFCRENFLMSPNGKEIRLNF